MEVSKNVLLYFINGSNNACLFGKEIDFTHQPLSWTVINLKLLFTKSVPMYKARA